SLTVTGVLNNAFVVNNGGTWVPNVGTVNGAITLSPGSAVGGTGSLFTPLTVTTGVGVSPASPTTIGVMNFQNLTLNSGSILNLTVQGIPKASDNVNILTGGSLSLNSGIV